MERRTLGRFAKLNPTRKFTRSSRAVKSTAKSSSCCAEESCACCDSAQRDDVRQSCPVDDDLQPDGYRSDDQVQDLPAACSSASGNAAGTLITGPLASGASSISGSLGKAVSLGARVGTTTALGSVVKAVSASVSAGAHLESPLDSLSCLASLSSDGKQSSLWIVNGAATKVQSHYRGLKVRRWQKNQDVFAHFDRERGKSTDPFMRTMDATASLAGAALNKTKEKTLIAVLYPMLDSIGNLAKEALKDDDMPEVMKSKIEMAHATVWTGVKGQIIDVIMASTSFEEKNFQKSLIRFRAKPPRFWPRGRRFPQPYRWFRAKFLHTLMPSDGTFWTTARDPWVWVIRLMMSMPLVGVLMFVLLFFLIDKRDEASGRRGGGSEGFGMRGHGV